MTDARPKKGPGRPRKPLTDMEAGGRGIVDTPTNSGNVMEMMFCNQKSFKKIFSLFRAYDGIEIDISFSTSTVVFSTMDVNSIRYVIDCSRINLYYCLAPISIIIHRENFEKMFANIDKFNYKITFILDAETSHTKMHVIIDDNEFNTTDDYYVDQIIQKDRYHATLPNYLEYPLRFKISAKHFKKKINDIAMSSNVIIFQKNGDDFLEITYPKLEQSMYHIVTYKDDKNIDLVYTLGDDITTLSVALENIKPFSSSIVGDEVCVYVANDMPLVLTTQIEKRNNLYVTTLEAYITPYTSRNI
jgi:hypothetical protein